MAFVSSKFNGASLIFPDIFDIREAYIKVLHSQILVKY
jgi:hypothetical protein